MDQEFYRQQVRLDDVISDLQQARNLRILILDSCRDNPLADDLRRSIGAARALSLQRGLAKIDSPQGMVVSYATQPGRTAEDGEGRNSPYTAAFLRNIEQPEEIGAIFRHITADVYEATKHEQLPELSLSLIGDFYLRGERESAPAQKQDSQDKAGPCAAATDHWRSAEAVGTAAAFKDHLDRFPNCAYAGLAKARLAKLTPQDANLPSEDRLPAKERSKPSSEGRDQGKKSGIRVAPTQKAAFAACDSEWKPFQAAAGGDRERWKELGHRWCACLRADGDPCKSF